MKHYVGVPQKVESILGEIETVKCGDYNSFAVVKI